MLQFKKCNLRYCVLALLTALKMLDGVQKTLLVHRKGSTRAFPPHHPLIPVDYQVSIVLYFLSVRKHGKFCTSRLNYFVEGRSMNVVSPT